MAQTSPSETALPAEEHRERDQPADEQGQEALLRDIDATIARLETGIAQENAALDRLLNRLTRAAA